MRLSSHVALACLVVAQSLGAQQSVTPATLEAQTVARPDTTIALRVGGRELLAELRVPTGPGPHPVAIVIHGGCWVTKFADARYMRPLAEALRQSGIATFNISYRRADESGGAWPGTFLDVAAQAARLSDVAPRFALDLRRVLAIGHSSGAHLALWLAANPKLPRSSAIRAAANGPPIAGVVALDGPGDLVAFNSAAAQVCGTQVLEQLLATTPADNPDRWRDASPSAWLPLGVPQAMVRGGLDASMGRRGMQDASMLRYAERARVAGDSAWAVNADTMSHFAMLEPRDPAFAVVLQAVRDVLVAMRTAGTPPRRPE